ncbi:hypothetical protein C7S16_2611 [Burkholderia thailandensis]|uniref:Uncharacterized protein n=1 Tax=Burkholderia thailandensis TaxID=57975 RepID=A0AAW9CZ96_BURTH|nr:hypothetical protein [Burkholderia thailandensis]
MLIGLRQSQTARQCIRGTDLSSLAANRMRVRAFEQVST